MDRALIQFICVRRTHRRAPPVDPSSPFNVAEEGGWAYCPGGEADGHKWFKTGGITRAALDKFEGPDEEEAEPQYWAGTGGLAKRVFNLWASPPRSFWWPPPHLFPARTHPPPPTS